MKEKLDPAAAAQVVAEAKAEIHRIAFRVHATRRGRYRACPARGCRRQRICLGGQHACAPKPPRARKPISRAELMRRVRGAVAAQVSRLTRTIAASPR
jgi:hypothetical protein